jgi:hypothetical protein
MNGPRIKRLNKAELHLKQSIDESASVYRILGDTDRCCEATRTRDGQNFEASHARKRRDDSPLTDLWRGRSE